MRTTPLLICIGSIGTAAASPQVLAASEELDYSYIQLDVVGRDIDAFDEDADLIEDFDDGGGASLRASYAFNENVFVFGGYSETESDVSFSTDDVFPLPDNTDIKRLDLGVGLARELNARLDFVGRLGYSDIDFGEFDVGAGSDVQDLDEDSSDGFFVDAGVRSQLLDNLEGSIGVRYLDIETIDNTSLIGSLLFELSPSWDLDLSIDAGDELSTYMLGVRFSPSS